MEGYLNSFDGTQLFYQLHEGNKPITLVFLHGIGGNWTIWKKEIEYFKSKGYPILTQDLRGHGKSDYPNEFHSYGLTCFTKDLHALLQHHKIQNFALIGHSLGGSIGITYCMEYHHPYPKSLVLVETPATYPFEHDRLLNYSPYIVHLARFIASHTELRNTHFPGLEEVDLSEQGIKSKFKLISALLHFAPIKAIIETLDNIEEFVHKNQKRVDKTLQNLKIPTLLIAGDQDQTVPVEFSKYIKRLKRDAELRIVKDSHHKITVEHSEEVCHILYKFVEHKLVAIPHIHIKK